MTNEQAIQVIKIKSAKGERAEKLAALYVMDDIVNDDIDTWINADVSSYLTQFPDIARDLSSDLIKEGVSKERLAEGLCDVSESVYYYVKFHELLTSYDMALSER
mgnify:FL=1